MLRYLPYIIEMALLVFCLIDCIQSDSLVVRNLSKGWWLVLIIFVPLIGPIAWLVAGRPQGQHTRRSVPWPSGPTAGFPEYERPRAARGPDDDPAFLAELRRSNDEHEKMLEQWEADLKRRERELNRDRASED